MEGAGGKIWRVEFWPRFGGHPPFEKVEHGALMCRAPLKEGDYRH
jgi:hypothetical protein